MAFSWCSHLLPLLFISGVYLTVVWRSLLLFVCTNTGFHWANKRSHSLWPRANLLLQIFSCKTFTFCQRQQAPLLTSNRFFIDTTVLSCPQSGTVCHVLCLYLTKSHYRKIAKSAHWSVIDRQIIKCSIFGWFVDTSISAPNSKATPVWHICHINKSVSTKHPITVGLCARLCLLWMVFMLWHMLECGF